MNKLHIKRDDTVVILSGKDKGKKGKVLETSPKEQKVIVEGVNMVTKHVKPRPCRRAGRHRFRGGRHVRRQSDARLPVLWQAHPCRPQGAGGWYQNARLQEVQRDFLK